MKIGLSTACMYPQLTEVTLRQYLEAGVPIVEVFLNTDRELDSSYLKALKEMAKGVRFAAVHPYSSGWETFQFFSDYERRFWDGVERYKRFFEAASVLEAEWIHFHGCRREWPIETSLYLDRYQILHQTAREFGVRLCQENVRDHYSAELAFLEEMQRQIPDVCFTLDLKQARIAGMDPLDAVKKLGERIKHVHGSDGSPGHPCVLPGRGNFDFPQFVEKLRKLPSSPTMVLELYRRDFESLDELLISFRFLEALL